MEDIERCTTGIYSVRHVLVGSLVRYFLVSGPIDALSYRKNIRISLPGPIQRRITPEANRGRVALIGCTIRVSLEKGCK